MPKSKVLQIAFFACAPFAFPNISYSETVQNSKPVPVGEVFYMRALNIEYSKPYSQVLHPQALAAYENAANLGSDKAMIRLATSSKATGDAAKTKYWYKEASDAGNTIGRLNLGKIYVIEGNCEEGIPLIENARNAQNYEAKYFLANALFNDLCPNSSTNLMIEINEETANFGLVFSVFRLAKIYSTGKYGVKNLPKAWGFAKIASLKGYQRLDNEEFKPEVAKDFFAAIDSEIKKANLETAAWNELKAICEKGAACASILLNDLPKDLKINIPYPPAPMAPPPPVAISGYNSMAMEYNKSISNAQYKAMYEAHNAALAAELEYRKANKFNIKYEEFRQIYLKPVELGNPLSMRAISKLYFEDNNIKKGREWLEKAATNGSYLAQWEWANFLIEDKKDCPLIAKYLENAWRVAQPQYYNMAMGKLYNGEVCADFRNEVKAINSYTRAANVGIVAAMVKLSEIYARKELPDYDSIRALTWARIAYALSPERGFFAPPEIKALKKFLEAGYKTLDDEAKKQVISDTNAICSAYAICNAISDADIMKLQTFDIN